MQYWYVTIIILLLFIPRLTHIYYNNVLIRLLYALTVTSFPFLKSQSLNTEECCLPADTVSCMDSVLLSANLVGNVSSDLEDDPELFQDSGGRILFAI
jgi:hypothetical protein